LDFIKKKKINYISLNEESYIEDSIDTNNHYQDDKKLKQIHQEIKKLPDGARIVLVLHLFNGLKHREIAEKLDISVSTCKSQYHRAKDILRQRINHYSS
jgi:RNA polymerase sigma-70 factor (ECF subfamily)